MRNITMFSAVNINRLLFVNSYHHVPVEPAGDMRIICQRLPPNRRIVLQVKANAGGGRVDCAGKMIFAISLVIYSHGSYLNSWQVNYTKQLITITKVSILICHHVGQIKIIILVESMSHLCNFPSIQIRCLFGDRWNIRNITIR